MRNFSRIAMVLAALLVILAPGARAAAGNSNWLTKAFHHQSKPSKHPERDSFKARERQDKFNDRNGKQRQRVADKHALPKEKKNTTTPSKPVAPPQDSQS
jgi:hypothetical protein